MCCNCMLTLRECYWKTDSQWETGITFLATCRSVLKICLLIPGPSQSQHQLPCSSGSVPSSLGNVLWQSLSSLLVTSALQLSWSCLILTFEALHSPPLSHMLYFWVMLPTCGLHPASPSQLSCLGVTPTLFLSTALRMWCSFPAVSTMLSLLTCFDACLPEDLLLSCFLQGLPSIHISI